jgi:HPt (histidine-containing phosphotransfer) domain-containing protein
MQERMNFQNNVGAVFSEEDTLACVDGDLELLREIVGMYLNECPESVAAIRKSIDEQNAFGLCRSAHSLKGLVGNFGAHAAVDKALKLEMMGKSSDLANAEEVFASLRKELECLKLALEQFIGET